MELGKGASVEKYDFIAERISGETWVVKGPEIEEERDVWFVCPPAREGMPSAEQRARDLAGALHAELDVRFALIETVLPETELVATGTFEDFPP